MKRNLIIAGVSVVVALCLTLVAQYMPAKDISQNNIEGNNLSDSLVAPDLSISPITFDPNGNVKDQVWNVFQKYLAFNKAKNIEGVRSVVYKIAPVCEDPKTTIDCYARMAAAYDYGILLAKKDFINVWQDDKQIILVTEFWIEDSESSPIIGRFRSILFFLKDASNNKESNLKLLSFSPTQGGATSKGEATKEELETRIVRYSEDTDLDGIADYNEECLGLTEGQACTKTDPKLRDTDSDGFWDGVEVFMK